MVRMFLILAALFLVASPVFAQEAAGGAGGGALDWRGGVGAGIAMAIASGLCALAQGKAVASSAEGMARNPGAGAAIRGALLLGLILIESLALYTLVIILLRIE